MDKPIKKQFLSFAQIGEQIVRWGREFEGDSDEFIKKLSDEGTSKMLLAAVVRSLGRGELLLDNLSRAIIAWEVGEKVRTDYGAQYHAWAVTPKEEALSVNIGDVVYAWDSDDSKIAEARIVAVLLGYGWIIESSGDRVYVSPVCKGDWFLSPSEAAEASKDEIASEREYAEKLIEGVSAAEKLLKKQRQKKSEC